MTAEIIGYPSVVFCSTSPSLDDQERTRLLVLSPEVNQEKMREAIYLASEKNSDRESWWDKLETDARRKLLQDRIVEIKKACIKQVIIPKELCEIITKRFFCEHRNLIPRNMRDFTHLTQLIKSWAILNYYNRERKGDAILARSIDVEMGFNLYSAISESNELGLTPEINDVFKKVIKPTLLNQNQKNEIAVRRDFSSAYYIVYNKPISPKRLDMILLILDSVGLIETSKDERDRRLTKYTLIDRFSGYSRFDSNS